MERLSDTAIEIINDLHTERLEYASEYIPLIDAANKLAEYEDLEEQGLLLRLPCKVGTPVYNTTWWDDVTETITVKGTTYYRSIIKHKVSKSNFSLRDLDKFGKEVFLTKEEAEKKLREMEVGE